MAQRSTSSDRPAVSTVQRREPAAKGVVSRRHFSRHAVVFGALGQGNRGDDALLGAIVEWMNDRYDAITVMLSQWDDDLLMRVQRQTNSSVVGELTPPMRSRRRPWFGRRERSECAKRLVARPRGAPIDAFWIGGLLGHIWQHNRQRCLELEWAARFADSLTYFFGDVGESFVNTAYSHRWVRIAQSVNMHIAVRSREAADTLRHAGLPSKIPCGIDPALFACCQGRGIPFKRIRNCGGGIALNPCIAHIDQWKHVWLGLAKAAAEQRLTVHWISTCDADDLSVCERLACEAAERHPSICQQIVGGNDSETALASAEYAVAARYHGAIFAVAAGVPTMLCPYGAKVRRLADLLGLADFTFSHEMTSEEVAAQFAAMTDQIEAARGTPNLEALIEGTRRHGEALVALEAALELKSRA